MTITGYFHLRVSTLCLFATVILAGMAPRAMAQNVVIVKAGDTEVGGFVGGSYGLDSWRVMGGGNVAYGVTRYLMPYAEFSYLPGITRQLTTSNGSANYQVGLTDFHGGVHIRFPLGQSRVVPYAVAGAGLIHSSATPVTITFPDGFTVNDTIASSTNFAVNFGGGLRYYATERVGFRFEGKMYKPTGTYTTPFYKIECGVFFQFR